MVGGKDKEPSPHAKAPVGEPPVLCGFGHPGDQMVSYSIVHQQMPGPTMPEILAPASGKLPSGHLEMPEK